MSSAQFEASRWVSSTKMIPAYRWILKSQEVLAHVCYPSSSSLLGTVTLELARQVRIRIQNLGRWLLCQVYPDTCVPPDDDSPVEIWTALLEAGRAQQLLFKKRSVCFCVLWLFGSQHRIYFTVVHPSKKAKHHH